MLSSSYISDIRLTQTVKQELQRRCLIGKKMADDSLCKAARHHRVVIITNPVNSSSYAWFLDERIKSKTIDIRGRTLRKGLLAGLVQDDPSLQKTAATFLFENQVLTAVSRESTQLWTREPLPTDQILTVSCSDHGHFISSDIDILTICAMDTVDCRECLLEEGFGQLVKYEKQCIQTINGLFQNVISSHFPKGFHYSFNLITHGPGCRFDGSKRRHIHFPITFYYPNGTFEHIGSEDKQEASFKIFENKIASLRAQGYQVPWNPRWSL